MPGEEAWGLGGGVSCPFRSSSFPSSTLHSPSPFLLSFLCLNQFSFLSRAIFQTLLSLMVHTGNTCAVRMRARTHTHPSLQILGCPNLMPFLPLTPSPLTALSTAVGTLQGEGTWEGTDHRAVGGTCLGEGSRVGEGTRSPQQHLSLGKHKKSFDLLLPPYPL